jgi:hypothetical protein
MKKLNVLVAVAVALVCPGCALRALAKSKETLAETKVQVLDDALELYKYDNGRYPASLTALTETQPKGGAPLIQAEHLLDPWGQPFNYDPAGPHNEGKKPDVWCKAPTGRVIGNWGVTGN